MYSMNQNYVSSNLDIQITISIFKNFLPQAGNKNIKYFEYLLI